MLLPISYLMLLLHDFLCACNGTVSNRFLSFACGMLTIVLRFRLALTHSINPCMISS